MSTSTSNGPPKDPEPRDRAFDVRRRLLKAGAAASPLAFAVATRPARATDHLCRQPSAFGSMHASGPGREYASCTGRTPGYWKQQQHFVDWPAPYVPVTTTGIATTTATLFHQAGFHGSQLSGLTLLDALGEQGNAGGYGALARHIVAALLNAASGKTPVLSVMAVHTIWNDFVATGRYEPTAGVHWDAEKIVVYLKSTMPL